METRSLESQLTEIKALGRKALVPYFMGGWPDRRRFLKMLRAAVEAGADAVEVGLAHSDPVADGPVIQRAGRQVLDRGVRPDDVFDAVAEVASDLAVPLILMTYANMVLRPCAASFLGRAADAGFTGLVLPDLPIEEWDRVQDQGMALIPFVAPTTNPERLSRAARAAQGFVYLVSVTGVTGSRPKEEFDIAPTVTALRRETDLPLYAGFGVASARQAARAAEQADGVIVGSALISSASGADNPAAAVGTLLKSMRTALDRKPGREAVKGGES
jgi:tryptophan synthase alpha chain